MDPARSLDGLAVDVQAATQHAFELKVNGVASASFGTQQASLQDASTIAILGANRAATIGAIFCAEGANLMMSDAKLAASDFASCQDHFSAAQRLSSSRLTPDIKVLASSGAIATFDEFEKNFGVSQGEYLGRILAAKGGRETLSDLLGSAVPEERLQAAYAAANLLPPQGAPADYAVSFTGAAPAGRVLSSRAAPSGLREKLRARLEEAEQPSDAMSSAASSEGNHIEPLARSDFFGFEEPAAEAASMPEPAGLTLFEVVHRKYVNLGRRLR